MGARTLSSCSFLSLSASLFLLASPSFVVSSTSVTNGPCRSCRVGYSPECVVQPHCRRGTEACTGWERAGWDRHAQLDSNSGIEPPNTRGASRSIETVGL